MKVSLDPYLIKTVPPTFSWDEGPLGENGTNISTFLTSFSSLSASTTENEDGITYVGYAPFVFLSLSSYPGDVNEYHVGMEREVNFGDYYNDSTNIVSKTGLRYELFNHVYVMPGTYTIQMERTDYLKVQAVSPNIFGGCLQKHSINWVYNELVDCTMFSKNKVTWASTKPGGVYEKKWKYEPCEDVSKFAQGLYIQDTGISNDIPIAWQWHNFGSVVKAGPYMGKSLTWENTSFLAKNQLRWEQTYGPCLTLEKNESTVWRWGNIRSDSDRDSLTFTQSATWEEMQSDGTLPKTWEDTTENCSILTTNILSSDSSKVVKKAFVKVLEIPPVVYLTCQQPEQKTNPLTVRLSPKNIISGSFPIEKIVWDLGDGSPLLTQRRWAPTLEAPFVHARNIPTDPNDPRNFDVEYTYTRTLTGPSTFYPSITAYASSTGTSDNAATVVGPIEFKDATASSFKLIQNELTEKGKILVGQVGNTVTFWRSSIDNAVPTSIFNYNHFGYYSSDRNLISNKSKIYKTKFSNSSPVRNGTGFDDVDKDGNIDVWSTDRFGTISWSMQIVHPYTYGTIFYFNDSVPQQNTTIVYEGPGTGASIIPNLTAKGVDIDGDGKIDIWFSDSEGRLSWTALSTQPFSLMEYYIKEDQPIKNQTILYSSPYSNAAAVSGLNGTFDIDGDGSLDNWNTTSTGLLSWYTVPVHPYSHVGYFSDDEVLVKNQSIIYSSIGNGATLLTGASGEAYIDQDFNLDVWTTNNSGIITWSTKPIHPYNTLGSYFTDTTTLTSGVSILWNGIGSNAYPVPDAVGVATVNEQQDEVNWETDDNGVITWTLKVVHPYENLGYFTDTANVVNGTTVLWNGKGTGAIVVSGVTGTVDANGDGVLDVWETNELGVVSIVPASLVGTYWKSSQENSQWFDLANWFFDKDLTLSATQLPLSSTNVVLSRNTTPPIVDLADSRWVAPSSIDLKYSRIIFITDQPSVPNVKFINSAYNPVVYRTSQ